MAITEPIVVANSGNPGTFNEDMDYTLGWMAQFVAELNAMGYPNIPVRFRLNGTAAAPALTWDNDPNTGLYHPAADQLAASAGGVMRWLLSADGFQINAPITGTAVQSAQNDATPNRLLKVGAFGLGATATYIGNLRVTDNSIPPGLYSYSQNQGSAGGPGPTFGNVVHLRRASGGGEAQLFFGDDGSLYLSARSAGNWTAWKRLDTLSGTNSNGDFQRTGGGVQECWGRITTSASGEAVVTFPAAFVESPNISLTPGAGAAFSLAPRFTALSATGFSASCFNSSDARLSLSLHFRAIGRWF